MLLFLYIMLYMLTFLFIFIFNKILMTDSNCKLLVHDFSKVDKWNARFLYFPIGNRKNFVTNRKECFLIFSQIKTEPWFTFFRPHSTEFNWDCTFYSLSDVIKSFGKSSFSSTPYFHRIRGTVLRTWRCPIFGNSDMKIFHLHSN